MERITADNFITDNKTNKVLISSLIDGETGGLDVDARTSWKASILKFARNGELLYNTLDVWARDYMPVQLTHDVFLSFTYKPDYLQDSPDYVTNWQVHRVHTRKQLAKEVPYCDQSEQILFAQRGQSRVAFPGSSELIVRKSFSPT